LERGEYYSKAHGDLYYEDLDTTDFFRVLKKKEVLDFSDIDVLITCYSKINPAIENIANKAFLEAAQQFLERSELVASFNNGDSISFNTLNWDFLASFKNRMLGFDTIFGKFINEGTASDFLDLVDFCRSENKHLFYNGYKFHRLLETDNPLLLPTNVNIKLSVTAEDVIHSWAVPSFGVKIDAIPGRVNEA
jgi:heme/copper-type cytochrome/quinol oxidase subunit 2